MAAELHVTDAITNIKQSTPINFKPSSTSATAATISTFKEKPAMAATFWVPLFLLFFIFQTPSSQAQQEYVNNKQLDCNNNYNSTDGNLCNSDSSCLSYLTFRSSSPQYNSPSAIASLLNSTPTLIANANNISEVDSIPTNTMIIVPVNCSCSGDYYQHNSSYVLETQGQGYFSVANNTYQALTTCQALEAQNTYAAGNLTVGLDLNVPLRCACPTSRQIEAGFKYLLTYLVSEGEAPSSIAELFGVDTQSVLDANQLSSTSVIYFFTPLLVPLKQEPTKIQTVASPPPPPSATPTGDGDSNSSKKWVIVGVTVGVAFLLLLTLLGFLWFYRGRRYHHPVEAKPFSASATTETTAKKVSDSTTTESWSVSLEGLRYAIDSLTVYKFEDLQKATDFFSEATRIKGPVYRASFKGDNAAVKILKGDVSGEINILKRINHTNIIRLSGFCVYKGDTFLVYEFAENGSLEDWLHSEKSHNSITLTWKQRVQIAHDIADALNYLHNYTNPPHIHKNLKSENVLLDGNFRGKVSSFGLARVMEAEEDEVGFQMTRHVVGTQGYMPPEYIENGLITPKMDVFAFGVVILELLSGREAIVREKNSGSKEEILAESMIQVLEGDDVKEKIRAFMDPTLKDEYPLDFAFSMTQIARDCVARDLNSRPSISDVLMTLSKIQSSSLDWDPSEELEKSRSVRQMSGGR